MDYPNDDILFPGRGVPNGWGYQQYNRKICIPLVDEQVNVNNHRAKKSFIRTWVDKHIDGVRFKKRQFVLNKKEPPVEEMQNPVNQTYTNFIPLEPY